MATEKIPSGAPDTLISDEQNSDQRRRSVGRAMLSALYGERTHGKQLKDTLRDDLLNFISANERYTDKSQEEDSDLLTQKLLRFRPRLVGAVGTYAHLTGNSYDQLVQQDGLENFYLFWALGSIQDDFIERRSLVGRSIFGDNRRFYRAAHHLLRQNIKASSVTEAHRDYGLEKISDWYRFLVDQEARVLNMSFEDLTFDFCRTYREDQNMLAGSTLVALLNGNNSLDPTYQKIEPLVAKFSFLTQIIDDIADTVEDLAAERPSYVVGALVDVPDELNAMRTYVARNPTTKLTPIRFQRIAPLAYDTVVSTFGKYSNELEVESGSKGITRLGGVMFRYFPPIRDILYKVNPKYANF